MRPASSADLAKYTKNKPVYLVKNNKIFYIMSKELTKRKNK